MDTKQQKKLEKCQESLGYWFRDQSLLITALTHSSCAPTHQESNERLEFLGDSVLGLVICHVLYKKLPKAKEGHMTKLKGYLVSRKICMRVAQRYGLDECIFVAGGITTLSNSIIANVIESLIGAVYLDRGFKASARLVLRLFRDELKELIRKKSVFNFKENLQQYIQRNHLPGELVYWVMDEKGPPHRRCFKIAVRLGSRTFDGAWAPTKKDAEQRAAQNALCELRGLDIPNSAGD